MPGGLGRVIRKDGPYPISPLLLSKEAASINQIVHQDSCHWATTNRRHSFPAVFVVSRASEDGKTQVSLPCLQVQLRFQNRRKRKHRPFLAGLRSDRGTGCRQLAQLTIRRSRNVGFRQIVRSHVVRLSVTVKIVHKFLLRLPDHFFGATEGSSDQQTLFSRGTIDYPARAPVIYQSNILLRADRITARAAVFRSPDSGSFDWFSKYPAQMALRCTRAESSENVRFFVPHDSYPDLARTTCVQSRKLNSENKKPKNVKIRSCWTGPRLRRHCELSFCTCGPGHRSD